MASPQHQGSIHKSPIWLCLALGYAFCAGSGFCLAAASVQTINEIHTFTHPAPAADTHFTSIVALSSKYAAVLGWRGTHFTPTHHDVFIFDAITGQYLRTLSEPVPPDNINFRFRSVAIDGNLAVIGAIYAHVPLPGGGIAYNAGAAYVYDLTTGQRKYKFVSDTPQGNFGLGESVGIYGDRIVVGSGGGGAYVLDATTGAQLARLSPSNPADFFGGPVAISESAIIVSGDSDPTPVNRIGAAHVYNPQTFALMSKFVPDNAAATANFATSLAIDGRYAIGSGGFGAYIFDVITGTQLRELALPATTDFGNAVDIQGTTALLGNTDLGRAMTFNWMTGTPLQDLVPSDFASGIPVGSDFGFTLALAGNNAIVAALGKAYEFRVVPEPSATILLMFGAVAGGLWRGWSAWKYHQPINA